MLKYISFVLFAAFVLTAKAQKDYSGEYVNESQTHEKELILLKIDSIHYKFWLNAITSSYIDYADGIIELNGNTGLFQFTNDDLTVCTIKLIIKSSPLSINVSHNGTCYLDISHTTDIYIFSNKNRINVSNFSNHYVDGVKYKVLTDKEYIYADSIGTKSKKQYFQKNDIVIHPTWPSFESANYIYIEYLSTNNKFVHGWISKRDIIKIDERP